MGNPLVTWKDIFNKSIKLSWYIRRIFNRKPKDLIEDMWRRGWEVSHN